MRTWTDTCREESWAAWPEGLPGVSINNIGQEYELLETSQLSQSPSWTVSYQEKLEYTSIICDLLLLVTFLAPLCLLNQRQQHDKTDIALLIDMAERKYKTLTLVYI